MTARSTRRLTVSFLGTLLLLSSGCKNVCEKARDHTRGCLESYCADHADAALCAEDETGEEQACTEQLAQTAEQLLELECDTLSQMLVGQVAAGQNFIRRSQATEAQVNLRSIAQSARAYYDREMVTPMGELLAPQFPASTGQTPREIPCGEAVQPRGADWETPTWQALTFAPRDAHRFAYAFESWGEGRNASFTVFAYGDLDCDGIRSTFRIEGSVDDGGSVRLSEVESTSEAE